MVYDVVNLLRRKLVKHRHGNGTIGQRGKERYRPVTHVAAAEGNLVAALYAAILKEDVKFLYLACHILVLQGGTFVVG